MFFENRETKPEKKMNELLIGGAEHYNLNQIKLAYSFVASYYNDFSLKETGKPWWLLFVRQLKAMNRVLDLGSGSGITAKFLIDHGLKVLGVDISPDMVNLARKQAPMGCFRCCDMTKLTYPERSLEGICSFFSFLHLPKETTKKMIENSFKWLGPGGIFAVTVVRGGGQGLCENFMGKKISVFLSYYKRKEFTKMLKSAGFTIIKISELVVKNENFDEVELFFLAKKT